VTIGNTQASRALEVEMVLRTENDPAAPAAALSVAVLFGLARLAAFMWPAAYLEGKPATE